MIKFGYIFNIALFLYGCSGLTSFVNNSIYEHALVETQLNENNWKIVFSGREVSMQKAIDLSLLKAGELSLDNGYKYFEIVSQEKRLNSYTVNSPAWSVQNKNGTYAHFPGGSRQVNNPNIETRIFMHNDNSLHNSKTYESELVVLSLSSSYSIDSIAFKKAEKQRRLEEERKQREVLRLAEEKRQQQVQDPKPSEEQIPQSGTGSGFFVSKLGHAITNAHVVQNCKKVTIGDNANKQVPAEVINKDNFNDLALLKLSSLEMASAESKSLIQKLGIVVVPLASKGLLRSEDVRLGERILVAGYPFGDAFSNSIKVTTGVVSSLRGVGDDSGQFQLDAAVQPGNSGGPIYDSSGNIVGVVISQLNKRTFGSLVENVNFGVKASTVRQFLTSSGLSSKRSERTEEKSTEQLAKIAQNQALMVICLQ